MSWLISYVQSVACSMIPSPTLSTISLPVQTECTRKEKCSKAIVKSRSVSSPSEPNFNKESSLVSQNSSNWSNASFLMLPLLCIQALRACWKSTRFATNAHPITTLLFVWKLVALLFNTHLLFGMTSEANIPLLAKATFKLLCFMTEISQNLTWWQRLAPRFLPEGAWFPLAFVFFPAVV